MLNKPQGDLHTFEHMEYAFFSDSDKMMDEAWFIYRFVCVCFFVRAGKRDCVRTCTYLHNPSGQDMTKGQFLSGV